MATTCIIPSDVTQVNINSFAGSSNIDTIVCPEGVTTIKGSCSNTLMTDFTLYLPKSLTNLNISFSTAMSANPTIYYAGSAIEWQEKFGTISHVFVTYDTTYSGS